MANKPKIDYDNITTITLEVRIRKKLGECVTQNETIAQGLERILDAEIKRVGKTI